MKLIGFKYCAVASVAFLASAGSCFADSIENFLKDVQSRQEKVAQPPAPPAPAQVPASVGEQQKGAGDRALQNLDRAIDEQNLRTLNERVR